MNTEHNRRDFIRLAALGSAALAMPGLACTHQKKKLKIGYTFITWGYNAEVLEEAVKHIAALGYHSFETFGNVIEKWENDRGGIGQLIDKYEINLQSAFCMLDVLDPSKIAEEAERMVTWGTLLKKYGGDVIVFTGRGKRNEEYKFMDHKDTIIEATNEYAKRVSDLGLKFVYHQHTGTPIEIKEEVYALMEGVDTDVVKFGPDIGQLQKGGTDPIEIVKDFLPLIEHVHLKDYIGGDEWVGYCPLGEGLVDIEQVLQILEDANFKGSVMTELDHGRVETIPPEEAAKISRDYLVELGYKFNV